MSENISREVFDAEISRLQAEYEKRCSKLEAAFELQRVKNRKDIELLRQSVDNLRDSFNRGITILGILITGIGVLFAGVQIYISLYLPVITK
ncbi:MAG: hypothetical protein IJF90_10055 [Synergistaceae bacterium]|nr:hypothetical protein [Synergistaceae bacterium]